MNRIVFVIPSMSGGGAERVIANLSKELVSRGKDVVILMTSGNKVDYELDSNITLISIGKETQGSIKKIINRLIYLRRFIKTNRDAGFICMEPNTNIYMLLSAIGKHCNIIVSERSDPRRYNHRLIRNTVYKCLGTKFVFQTHMAEKYFSFRRKKSKVIHNPIDSFLLPLEYVQKQKSIVAVGRLNEAKNYPILFKAFILFLDSEPDYRLVIYGKGELESSIRVLSSEMDLTEKIDLKGFVQNPWHEAVENEMYVLSSDYEGMPNALIEAMGMGMPVISTDCPIGGPKELIEDGVNGLLVPVGDEEALCEAMLKLARDEELREKLSKEAIKIREKLSVKNITDQWLDMLEQ